MKIINYAKIDITNFFKKQTDTGSLISSFQTQNDHLAEAEK